MRDLRCTILCMRNSIAKNSTGWFISNRVRPVKNWFNATRYTCYIHLKVRLQRNEASHTRTIYSAMWDDSINARAEHNFGGSTVVACRTDANLSIGWLKMGKMCRRENESSAFPSRHNDNTISHPFFMVRKTWIAELQCCEGLFRGLFEQYTFYHLSVKNWIKIAYENNYASCVCVVCMCISCRWHRTLSTFTFLLAFILSGSTGDDGGTISSGWQQGPS